MTVLRQLSLQNILLGIIGICLVLITVKLYITPVLADDYYIISRILYCIDGSSISGGSFSTYCNS